MNGLDDESYASASSKYRIALFYHSHTHHSPTKNGSRFE